MGGRGDGGGGSEADGGGGMLLGDFLGGGAGKGMFGGGGIFLAVGLRTSCTFGLFFDFSLFPVTGGVGVVLVGGGRGGSLRGACFFPFLS